jgi:hypothetical protein
MHPRESARKIPHPMLLPIILLNSDIGARQEKHQRDVRVALRKTATALYFYDGTKSSDTMSLEEINKSVISWRAKVWKNPGVSHEILDTVDTLLKIFEDDPRWYSVLMTHFSVKDIKRELHLFKKGYAA